MQVMIPIRNCYVCHDDSSFRSSIALVRFVQRIDVGDDVVDGVIANQRADHQVHLRTIQVVRVRAADAALEVLELAL
jgi:hypothetical protein